MKMVLELLGNAGIKFAAQLVGIGNIILLLGLLYFYIKSYREIKIGFTLGLILFVLLLMLQSVFSLISPIPGNNLSINTHEFIGSVIEFIALTILLIITWKY
jgi:membrane protease YdiL (CAAX protease family)